MTRFLLLFAGALLLVTPTLAIADLSGDYAVTVIDQDGAKKTQVGKIFLDGTPKDQERAMRMEISGEEAGQSMVFLTRPQDDTVFMLMPENKTYFSLSMTDATSKAPKAPGEGLEPSDFKEVGKERVNGIQTVVKEAPMMENGKRTGTVRIFTAPSLNDEPIKSEIKSDEGVTTTAVIENPTTKAIPESQFRVPEGYTETKLPSVGKIFEELGKDVEKEQKKEAGRGLEERLRKGLRF
jgi:hypothetical protein